MIYRIVLAFLMVNLSSLQAADDDCQARLRALATTEEFSELDQIEALLQKQADLLATPDQVANFNKAKQLGISEEQALEAASHLPNESFETYLDLVRASFKPEIAIEVAQLLNKEQLARYLEAKNFQKLSHPEALKIAMKPVVPLPQEVLAPKKIRIGQKPTREEISEAKENLGYQAGVDYLTLRYKFGINHSDAYETAANVSDKDIPLYAELRKLGSTHADAFEAAENLSTSTLKEYIAFRKSGMSHQGAMDKIQE